MVILDGQALGKPRDGVEASRMLKHLSGREHSVVTALVLLGPSGARGAGFGRSVVAFRQLSHEEIADYVASGEPLDKAGAYAIQGEAGEFVALVSGRVDTVIGLPLHVASRLGRRLACPAFDAPG